MKLRDLIILNKKAYTLIELLTVLSLTAIIMGTVLPVMNNFFANQRVSNEASNFVQNLRLGRYKSLGNQAIHRLIFSDDLTTYKLEARVYDDIDDRGSPPTAAQYTDYESNGVWASILDEDEYEVDPGVEIIESMDSKKCIFFWPNGTLVTQPTPSVELSEANKYPLGDNKLAFVYGEAGILVRFGYMGAMSSEDYNADEDDNLANDDAEW